MNNKSTQYSDNRVFCFQTPNGIHYALATKRVKAQTIADDNGIATVTLEFEPEDEMVVTHPDGKTEIINIRDYNRFSAEKNEQFWQECLRQRDILRQLTSPAWAPPIL